MGKSESSNLLLILFDERPLSINKYYAGMHWAKRKQEADRVHEIVRVACTQWKADNNQRLPKFQKARITMTVYFRSKPFDPSNIPAKLYEDGLVRVGVLPDDSPQYVQEIILRSRVDRENPRVEIAVEEMCERC